MLKLVTVLLAVMLVSCATRNKNPYNDSRGDADAFYAQSLMSNTVLIREDYWLEAEGLLAQTVSVSEPMTIVGSGVVVESNLKSKKSIVLTAWHVCSKLPVGYTATSTFGTVKVVRDEQYVQAIDSKRLNILKTLYLDKNSDTCVIEVDGFLPGKARLANEMPPRGALVDVVGAPEGKWGYYLAALQSGRYFGLTEIDIPFRDDQSVTKMKDFAYYGFAGTKGFSGSGVYYKGRLIGLMTARSPNYEHASFGPSLKHIKQAMSKSGY